MNQCQQNILHTQRRLRSAWAKTQPGLSINRTQNIRIYHECEGRIEQSVPRIAVWHHEACRVMTNDDPEGRIFFYPTLTRIMDSFSCSPLFICLFIYLFIYLFIF